MKTTETKPKKAHESETQRQVDLILELAEQTIEENEHDHTHPDDERRARDQRDDFEAVKAIIHAAPELLEALREINNLLAEYASDHPRQLNPNHYRGRNGKCPGTVALAAIAKAEGYA